MRDPEKRRAQLLLAAREIFGRKGYQDTRVEDIAAAAQVAKGTFYLYFSDKRSVFVELVDGFFSRLNSAILAVDITGDVAAQVKHNIRAVVAVLMDDPAVTQMLLAHSSVPDQQYLEKIRSFFEGSKALLATTLTDGQKLGIVAPGDASLYATFTVGALKELLLEQVMTVRSLSREQLVADLYEFLQRGYLRIDTRDDLRVSHGKSARNAER